MDITADEQCAGARYCHPGVPRELMRDPEELAYLAELDALPPRTTNTPDYPRRLCWSCRDLAERGSGPIAAALRELAPLTKIGPLRFVVAARCWAAAAGDYAGAYVPREFARLAADVGDGASPYALEGLLLEAERRAEWRARYGDSGHDGPTTGLGRSPGTYITPRSAVVIDGRRLEWWTSVRVALHHVAGGWEVVIDGAHSGREALLHATARAERGER